MPQAKTFPEVICPGCNIPMHPMVTESAPNGLHKTTYRCDKCATEIQRIYKRDSGSQNKDS